MDEQEWLAGYQSPPPATLLADDDVCPECGGERAAESDEAEMYECPTCHGTGRAPVTEIETEPVNTPGSVQRHDPTPHPLDLGPSGAEADAVAEAKRLAENDRFKIWEDGFMAGMHSVNGERRKNPYTWHGISFVPPEADLNRIEVRVFIGSQEVKVSQIGSIVRDRRGTRIEQVFIHPEPGAR